MKPLGIAVLLLAGLATSARSADDAEPKAPGDDSAVECPLKVYARIDMIDLQSGLVAIPVKIEDRDLYFMLDTGGVINTISQDVVDEMKLQQIRSPRRLIGVGRILDSFVTPKSFSIGPINGADMQFFVEPLTIPGLAGALGPDTMRKFDVDFDFAGGKFGIFSPDHCPGKVVYWTKEEPIAAVPMTVDNEGHVRMTIGIDGKDVTAALDTGADFSFMSMSAARTYLGIDEKSPGLIERDRRINNTLHKTYSYPFQSLKIADVTIDRPLILILEDEDMIHLGTDVVLGMNALRQLHIYIAYQEGKLYMTPAAAH